MAQSTSDSGATAAPSPSLGALFLAFSGMAVMGFGGVLPWARRMLVEEKGWLTADEFTEVLSLSQFLPGGNIINLAVVVGQRIGGWLGSVVAVAGLMAGPVVIVLVLGSVYLRYGQIPQVHDALGGVASAAAGLILAMAAKMAAPLFRRGAGVALGFAVAAFVAVGLLGLNLPLVVLVLAPISVWVAWRRLA